VVSQLLRANDDMIHGHFPSKITSKCLKKENKKAAKR